MNTRRIRYCLFALCSYPAFAATAGNSQTVQNNLPVALRYVLKIDTPYFFDIRATRGKNKIQNHKTRSDIEIEAIADKLKTYVVENRMLDREEVFSTLLLEFDRKGEPVSRLAWPDTLSSSVDAEGVLRLSPKNNADLKFGIGSWVWAEGKKAKYSPALCTDEDFTRYQEGVEPTSVRGNFGCREWSYYLQNRKIPYIDVTSYQYVKDPEATPDRRGRVPEKLLATIKPVLGWGSFDLPQKPVIGRHGDSWFCLQDCPDGDLPGYIPNIKTWLSRHHWPMPKSPKKLPIFQD